MTKRNLYLDTAYESSRGLLDDVSTEELEAEKVRLDLFLTKCNQKDRELQDKKNRISRKRTALTDAIETRRRRTTIETLVVSDDHRTMLAALDFQIYPNGGDYVFLGVEGKRPFGSSGDWYPQIAELLGWDLPNEEPSFEQCERIDQLLYELPFALNKILERPA